MLRQCDETSLTCGRMPVGVVGGARSGQCWCLEVVFLNGCVRECAHLMFSSDKICPGRFRPTHPIGRALARKRLQNGSDLDEDTRTHTRCRPERPFHAFRAPTPRGTWPCGGSKSKMRATTLGREHPFGQPSTFRTPPMRHLPQAPSLLSHVSAAWEGRSCGKRWATGACSSRARSLCKASHNARWCRSQTTRRCVMTRLPCFRCSCWPPALTASCIGTHPGCPCARRGNRSCRPSRMSACPKTASAMRMTDAPLQ